MKKKILSLVLAVVMLLAMGVSAVALEEKATANIIVEGTDPNLSTAISAYKLIDVTYNPVTNMLSYEWNEAMKDWLTASYAGYDPATVPALPEGATAFYDKVAAAINDDEAPLPLQAETALTNLNMGQYIVLATDGVNVYAPMVANIVPVVENGVWTLNPATVVAKKTTPTIDKKINETEANLDGHDPDLYDTVEIGEKVTFDIRASVPFYPANSIDKFYTITDTMSTGLAFTDFVDVNKANFVLTVEGQGDVASKRLNYGTDYKVTIDGQKFTVDISGALYNNIAPVDENDTDVTVHITYKATITAAVELGVDTNLNTVVLTYSHNPYVDKSHKDIDDKVKVYTYGLNVDKYEKDAIGTKLSGAEFMLFTVKDVADEVAKGGQGEAYEAYLDQAMKFTLDNGTYKVSKATNDAQTLVTDQNGAIKIEGLKDTTYYLVETKAPTGYNKATAPFVVTVVKDGTEPKLIKDLSVSYVSLEVPNGKGIVPPSTGGMGTTIFTIAGIVLMGGVVLLLLYTNKKKAGQSK